MPPFFRKSPILATNGAFAIPSPGCLKAHADELFAQYPLIRLLTVDAIFAQRPLIEVLRNYGCDYLFQVRDNQHDTLEALTFHFKDAPATEPDDVTVEKKAAA